MAHDDGRLHDDDEASGLLADPIEVDLGDDDDEKDPLIAGDEDTEEKDWM